jgi:CRP/FNR family transcriptional regulator
MELLQQQSDVPLNFSAQLEDSEKDQLQRIGTKRVVAKNNFVFKAGQTDLNVYILNHGRVKLYGSSPEGRDVLLWFSVPGEIFGLSECLQLGPRQVYARAAEPCEILCITHAQFKSWLMTRPEVSVLLMRIMALRMRELGQRFLSLANGNIQREIAQLLLRLGTTYGELAGYDVHIGIPLTEQDIADMVGSSRQGVSACLAKMKRLGTIDIVKRYLIIKKHGDLQTIAGAVSGGLAVERRANRRPWQNTQRAR